MKNFIKQKTTVSLFIAILLSGCSLLEGDFSGEVHTTFAIHESSSGSNISYNNIQTINAEDDDDIRNNLDKVKNWSVEKISYKIQNYQGDAATTFSGSLGFSKISANSPAILVSVTGVNLSSLNNGPKQDSGLSASDLATIASWMDSDHKVKVYMQGVLSQGPVSFDLVVYATVKITAGIL